MFFAAVLPIFPYVIAFLMASSTIFAQDLVVCLEDLFQDNEQNLNTSVTRSHRRSRQIKSLPVTLCKPGHYELANDLTWSGQGCAITITSPGVVLDFENKTLRVVNQAGSAGICVIGAACKKDPVIVKNFTLILEEAPINHVVKIDDEQVCAFIVENSDGVIFKNGKVENFVCAFNMQNSSNITHCNITISGNDDFNKAFIKQQKPFDGSDIAGFVETASNVAAIFLDTIKGYSSSNVQVSNVPTASSTSNSSGYVVVNGNFQTIGTSTVEVNVTEGSVSNSSMMINPLQAVKTAPVIVVVAPSNSNHSNNSYAGLGLGALTVSSPFMKERASGITDVAFDDCVFVNTGSTGFVSCINMPQEFGFAALGTPFVMTNNNTFVNMSAPAARAFADEKVKKASKKKKRKKQLSNDPQPNIAINNSTFILAQP